MTHIALLGLICNATLQQCAEIQACLAERLDDPALLKLLEDADIGGELWEAYHAATNAAVLLKIAAEAVATEESRKFNFEHDCGARR